MVEYTATFRSATVQAEPVWLDADKTIDKAEALIAEAAGEGAEIIAFPETWIPGYPWWIWLDSPAWGMQYVGRYHANSIEIGDERFNRLVDAARRHRICVVAGYSERSGGSLYMGQAIIGADGKVALTRRKLKPTHVERSVFGEGDGSDLDVAELPIGRVGALCCWEHLQPLTKYAMFSLDEQVHVASWPSFSVYPGAAYALGPEVNTAASQQYAVEGQVFVLAPCALIGPAAIEAFDLTGPRAALLQPGGGHARVFGPDGRSLAEPLAPDEEGILYADIDLAAIPFAKAAADPVGHYSRPDVLRLQFNRGATPRVEPLGAGALISSPAPESVILKSEDDGAAAEGAG